MFFSDYPNNLIMLFQKRKMSSWRPVVVHPHWEFKVQCKDQVATRGNLGGTCTPVVSEDLTVSDSFCDYTATPWPPQEACHNLSGCMISIAHCFLNYVSDKQSIMILVSSCVSWEKELYLSAHAVFPVSRTVTGGYSHFGMF
jgi:hypothetical protein